MSKLVSTAAIATPTNEKSASTPAKTASANTVSDNNTYNGYRLPDNATLIHAAKLAIVEDKPVLLDYWTNSLDKQVLIGVKEAKDGEPAEKLLVKSAEEYTSPISKIYGSGSEFIIITENSIYIVDKSIPTKRISA